MTDFLQQLCREDILLSPFTEDTTEAREGMGLNTNLLIRRGMIVLLYQLNLEFRHQLFREVNGSQKMIHGPLGIPKTFSEGPQGQSYFPNNAKTLPFLHKWKFCIFTYDAKVKTGKKTALAWIEAVALILHPLNHSHER